MRLNVFRRTSVWLVLTASLACTEREARPEKLSESQRLVQVTANTSGGTVTKTSTASVDVTRLTPEAAGYTDLVGRFKAWVAEATARDIDGVAAFTWPESRAAVRAELLDSESTLTKNLIAHDGPFQRLIRTKTEVVAFEEVTAPSTYQVRYFSACVVSVSSEIVWPQSLVGIISLRRSSVFCTYWVSEKDGVFISYSYGLPDAG